ncbi:MAG: hypothetical protein ACOC35_05855 [Promethearchaeia archaeon]
MFQIDLARIIQVYVIQLGVGGIFYLIMAFLILQRDTKRLNKIFSMFFISIAIGTIVNVIYVAIEIRLVVRILNIVTYYFFCFGQMFLLIFSLILLKSERIIDSKKQIILINSFAALLLGLFIIGIGFDGVTLNDKWKPVWDLSFVLYSLLICGIVTILPTIFYSIKIYEKFQNEVLKKKWKFYLFGIIIYYIIWGGTSLSNFLDNPAFRTIWSLIALIGLISTYTIYYGVGKQI